MIYTARWFVIDIIIFTFRRANALNPLIQGTIVGSVGGSVEAFYFAFGDTDVLVIADLPDNVTAAAHSLFVNAAGTVAVKVTVLLTADEIDEAVKKTVSYRPPGQYRATILTS